MGLKLQTLTREFGGRRAVDGVTLEMEEGVYGLLGVNGAGKTTLMRMLCTLLRPSSGSIEWNGRDIFEMDGAYRQMLGYLPQDFGCYPEFTVEDYLLYVSSIKGLRPLVARRRADLLLEQVGLTGERKRRMRKLSGGMKRRVGIAQAMLNDPRILILDEPTAGLDPGERIRFRKLIGELAQDRLVLLSTHIVPDVEYIASRILLMQNGRIVRDGTSEALIRAMPVGVWSMVVPRAQAEETMRRFQTVNLRAVPGGVELRVLSVQRPAPDAQREEATLEDVFFHEFGEKAGGEDGAL